MTWSRGVLNNGLIWEATKMHLSVRLVFSAFCVGALLCPLNVFQNYSGVFLHQTSILLMVIWDQFRSSVKVFCVSLTLKWYCFLTIYKNENTYSFACSASLWWFIKIHSKKESKNYPWKNLPCRGVKTIHENDRNVTTSLVLGHNKNGL